MDALEALHTRVSVPKLGGDPPNKAELEHIFKAALRAADHGLLRPWRFLTVSGDARQALGELFVQAARQDQVDINQAMLEKVRNHPFRAPLIVIALACIEVNAKVPEIEQMISAGATVQNMMLAAHAQGIGAMWRTGVMAYHGLVEQGLGLASNEKIVGYLYLGSKQGRDRLVPDLDIDKYFTEWKSWSASSTVSGVEFR